MNKQNNKFRVAFLGRGKLGMNVLNGLLANSNIEVPVIITCSSSPELNFDESQFETLAQSRDIPLYKTNYINNAKYFSILESYQVDLAVAMLWLHKINHKIISTSKLGFINSHSGLLPKYRGNACGNWSILNGENTFGITTHFMKPNELDNGEIINQTSVPISIGTTVTQLTNAFQQKGADLVLEAVDQIYNGKLKTIEQVEEYSSYCYPRIPEDGYIDWNQTDDDILMLIRATTHPYPGAYTYFKHYKTGHLHKMVIYKLSKINAPYSKFYSQNGHLIRLHDEKSMAVCCGNKKLLKLEEIMIDQVDVDPYQYFKSVRQRLGIRIEDWIYSLAKYLR